MACTMTSDARERLGDDASLYVEENSIYSRGRDTLVPDLDRTPEDVASTLTRAYGRPSTIDRGETAYWIVPASDVVAEDD